MFYIRSLRTVLSSQKDGPQNNVIRSVYYSFGAVDKPGAGAVIGAVGAVPA